MLWYLGTKVSEGLSSSFMVLVVTVVGRIMVLCVTRLYPPVLTLRTDRCHYKPGILLLACFFDQIYRNPFSTSSKLWLLGHIIYRWKGIHEEIAAPLES